MTDGNVTASVEGMRNVAYRQAGGVVTIVLDRPERRNAFHAEMLAEFHWAVERAAADESVRVIVLRGAGTGFCAGDDLHGMGSVPEGFPYKPSTHKPLTAHLDLQATLREAPKPTVAAIHGFAAGVGLDTAMACDIRICTSDALLWDPRPAERGMHAATGVAYFLPRALGVTRAMEMIMLARKYSGSEAVEVGLATRAFPPEDFERELDAIVSLLASGPTKTFGVLKRQVYGSLNLTHAEASQLAHRTREEVKIEDRVEGIQAFLEKRRPVFTGR